MLQCVLLAGLLWVVVLMIKGVMRSLLWFSATSWQILFNPRQSLLDKPSAPSRHLAAVNSQKLSNRFVLFSCSCHQHDLGTLRQACECSATPRPAPKCVNFTFNQPQSMVLFAWNFPPKL